ncbi:MAG: adenylyl-sulfate reductase subunit alpha [Clostridium sp.]
MIINEVETDVLIIGAGAAGCFLGIELLEKSNLRVTLVDKGYIKRSGCLAAGVNALNAYITKGETENSYVDYVSKEFKKIVREDLVLSIAKRLNMSAKKIEDMGLTILKDSNGNYISRGKRSIKINGENIKPILYNRLKKFSPQIFEGVNITDYLMDDNTVVGAVGFSINSKEAYVIKSKITVCATGGASGIYKPSQGGESRHKMWYSPFNTGAGYAMGIRSGAEMTSLEMRFIALRCKDTIAPTGTIAQGIGAMQVNSSGEEYVKNYGEATTDIRLYSTIDQIKNGKGPCYLKTRGISNEASDELFKAYLNMAPMQVLKWVSSNTSPSNSNVEIDGTEPYIVGGHSGSGYWVDKDRKTTLKNLYAIGDVAGGSPKKYVTGCFAEAFIVCEDILSIINSISNSKWMDYSDYINEYISFFREEALLEDIEALEEKVQETMDTLAGGRTTYYQYSEENLFKALSLLSTIDNQLKSLRCKDTQQLMYIYEIRDRIILSIAVVNHMLERKETRWRSYGEFKDYGNINSELDLYINSVYRDGRFNIIRRNLVKRDEVYVHKNK